MGVFTRKRVAFGLDIGSGAVKLAEVGRGGDQPELRQVLARSLPAEAVADGEVVREDLLADVIEDVFDAASMRSRDVITALGGHAVFAKKVEIARMKGTGPRDLVRREAHRHVPFNLDDVRLDFQILRPDGPDGNVEALLVAAKQESVEASVSLLRNVGGTVALLDVEALALCNGLCHNHPDAREGTVALVNVGHEVTNLVMLDHGAPVLIRDLPLGLRRFAELLQRVHGLPAEWAHEVILGRRDLDGLDRALETGADVVAVGIQRACAFLGARRPGGALGRVYLSGGGACIPGVAEVFGRRMKVETRIVNPCQRISVAAGLRGRAVLARSAPLFLQAIGLALRGV